jgi:hypothetical protein
MKNPGVIAMLPDRRLVVIYNNQPLAEKGKIVYYLVDENYNVIKSTGNKPKTIIREITAYQLEVKRSTIIGYID